MEWEIFCIPEGRPPEDEKVDKRQKNILLLLIYRFKFKSAFSRNSQNWISLISLSLLAGFYMTRTLTYVLYLRTLLKEVQ